MGGDSLAVLSVARPQQLNLSAEHLGGQCPRLCFTWLFQGSSVFGSSSALPAGSAKQGPSTCVHLGPQAASAVLPAAGLGFGSWLGPRPALCPTPSQSSPPARPHDLSFRGGEGGAAPPHTPASVRPGERSEVPPCPPTLTFSGPDGSGDAHLLPEEVVPESAVTLQETQ